MAEAFNSDSRLHDLCAVVLGAAAAVTLASVPWNVDTSGPDPFYKGPLIFPLLVLSLIVLAALPSALRLLRPPTGRTWRLDGEGAPFKTLVVLALLIAHLFGMRLLGLEVSTLLFLLTALFYLGHRRLPSLILVPLVVTVAVVVVFKHLLEIWFPTPLLVQWWGG
jgi:hypothetical protein